VGYDDVERIKFIAIIAPALGGAAKRAVTSVVRACLTR